MHAEQVECLGCYRAQCDKAVTCMEWLDPEVVLAGVESVLRARAPAGAAHRVGARG